MLNLTDVDGYVFVWFLVVCLVVVCGYGMWYAQAPCGNWKGGGGGGGIK
jgi:hypothetical protein